MPKEWIDVADTAVKIGLGGLITGTFTYLGVKFSHGSDKDKLMLEHKIKLIEQIAGDIEEYFTAWDSYISKIAGITKHRKNNEIEDEELSVKQNKSINERDKKLVESWPKRESAIAKLRLMKATAVAKYLLETRSLEKEMRDRVVFDKDIPFYDDILEYRKSVKKAKKKVHVELANFYGAIHT